MTSHFDDRLIIGYVKMMIGLKKLEFHNPNFVTQLEREACM